MKRISCSLWFFGTAALLVASLPAPAGVSLDRGSASITVCPTAPSHIFRQAGPLNGCDVGGAPVIDIFDGAYWMMLNDDVDALATNEPNPPTINYYILFSGDMASRGALGTVYRG